MTKEEILHKHSIGKDVFIGSESIRLLPFDASLKAMDEYAKQEVLAFTRFTEFEMSDDDWLDKDGNLLDWNVVYEMYLKSKK